MIKLRILKLEGLSKWDLTAVTYILRRGRQREIRTQTQEEKATWPWRQRLE